MKVLLDAYWWFDGPPSGRNVVRSLATNWAKQFPQDQISVMLPRRARNRKELVEFTKKYSNLSFCFSAVPTHALSAVSAGIFFREFDVILTQNFAPLGSSATRTVFIHDLMFLEHPEWFTFVERAYLRGISISSRWAHKVFTSSHAEAGRVRRLLPHIQAPVRAVGLSLAEGFSNAPAAQIQGLDECSGFLLSVGRINVRKNLDRLASSLLEANLISPSCPLVIIGAPDGAPGDSSSLDSARERGCIIWTGPVTDSELKWAYRNCKLFIFPSLDEGFGLPVLEALSENCLIALSDIPAFREFGNVGTFFDPRNDRDIARGVRMALQNSETKSAGDALVLSWVDVVTSLRHEAAG